MPGLGHVVYTRRFHGGILRTEPVNGHWARGTMGQVCWVPHSVATEHKMEDAFRKLHLSGGNSASALSKLKEALKNKKR